MPSGIDPLISTQKETLITSKKQEDPVIKCQSAINYDFLENRASNMKSESAIISGIGRPSKTIGSSEMESNLYLKTSSM